MQPTTFKTIFALARGSITYRDARRTLYPCDRSPCYYAYTRNGSRVSVREATRTANAILDVARALGYTGPTDTPVARWCSAWRRTVASMEAEETGVANIEGALHFLANILP